MSSSEEENEKNVDDEDDVPLSVLAERMQNQQDRKTSKVAEPLKIDKSKSTNQTRIVRYMEISERKLKRDREKLKSITTSLKGIFDFLSNRSNLPSRDEIERRVKRRELSFCEDDESEIEEEEKKRRSLSARSPDIELDRNENLILTLRNSKRKFF